MTVQNFAVSASHLLADGTDMKLQLKFEKYYMPR